MSTTNPLTSIRARASRLSRRITARLTLSDFQLIALIWITWGLGDTYSTVIAAHTLGAGLEANPLMRWALHQGFAVFVLVKYGAALSAMAVIHVVDLSSIPFGRPWAAGLIGVGGFLTVTNLFTVLVL